MEDYCILITGANAGLGYATCCRLIDEFLATHQSPKALHLIFTTRDKRKRDDTLHRLQQHLSKIINAVYGSDDAHASIRDLQSKRIKLEGETVDLCSLRTVKDLASRLVDRKLHLDIVILNAGVSGWSAINWPQAVWAILTRWIEACTLPEFKRGHTGRVLRPQLTTTDKTITSADEPPLGETFTANVFGHYLLVHWLAPILTTPSTSPASRVIWTSSIEALSSRFSINDLQSLTTTQSYESSKRLTDLLVLSSESPAVQHHLKSYLPLPAAHAVPAAEGGLPQRPRLYVTHPGVCKTNISGIAAWLHYPYVFALYVARWLGSPWHPIDAYIGAVSAVWLALVAAEALDDLESYVNRDPGREVGEYEVREVELEGGKGKWGSATDFWGVERVVRTEVQGWGWGGVVGEVPDGLWKVATLKGKEKMVSKEGVEEFVETGAKCWGEMERLRMEWEKKLGG